MIIEEERTMKIKRILLSLSVLGALCVSAYGRNKKEDTTTSVLVAYFSATGTTARAAERIAEETGGTLYAITPEKPYTAADLDWTDKQSRCYVEMHDAKSRPAIEGKAESLEKYDVVYIGYPIWWGVAPTIVNTFIEGHDLRGKRLIPFATSGGSGIEKSVEALRKAYPGLTWENGRLMNR